MPSEENAGPWSRVRPSPNRNVFFDSEDQTAIPGRRVSWLFSYASHFESGDQVYVSRSSREPVSTSATAPESASRTRSRCRRSPYASFFPSGLQAGSNFHGAPSFVSCFGSPEPSAARTQISYSPVASERYATRLPSGDHAGARSRTPCDSVRLRVCPSFAGTLKRSPRASRITRAPLGERLAPETFSFTSFQEVASGARSVASVTGIFDAFSVLRSRCHTNPPFMKTIALPSAAREGQRTSNSANDVTFRVFFDFTSYPNRLSVRSRSDVK